MSDLLDEEEKDSTVILAVSVDDRERQQLMIDRVAEEHGATLDYTLLSDPGHRVIDRYGLFNEDAAPDRPIPHPTVYVIDRDGIVRWSFTEVDYRVRPENADILRELRALR
ncbi:MAG: redoxin domain-containing protein [Gemmatimonadetes bacterium]|nr:redoxin domain-containing protein [Gemmatimonadota bacterium]